MSTGRIEVGRGAPPGTRALLALVIGLGVLIVTLFAVVVVTLVHRTFGGGGHAAATLSTRAGAAGVVALGEPVGSRIVSVSTSDGRFALLVSGGGLPDRLLLLDARDGSEIASVRLAAAAAAPP